MILPFQEAVQRLDRKSAVGSALSSAEWEEVALGIRERAFFSAKIQQLHIIQSMQDKITQAANVDRTDEEVFMDRGLFVEEMKAEMNANGLNTGRRGLTNPASTRRLRLIYDFQIEDAQEFGRHKLGQDPALLDAFPAQELIRVESRVNQRKWLARWKAKGGKTYGGRMIAKKNDPVWTGISRFGRPWPPFDFGSGMGVVSIERDEAERLGVISSDETPEPQGAVFNTNYEQSLRGLSDDKVGLLEAMFKGAINIKGLKAALS